MKSGSPLATFGWGVFCASSWTWCIGMFLPIIMFDRYGWPGFLIFAIPNVLGCALFGYVLKGPERSRRLVARHRGMMRIFSSVTVAYHVFFLGMLVVLLSPYDAAQNALWALIIPAAFLALALLIGLLPDRLWPWLAGAVYALSLIAFTQIGTESIMTAAWSGERPAGEWGWLLPTVAFGFLLCPYLDLTFHRALQRSGSSHAFGVFGLTFAVMILFTVAYRDRFDTDLVHWIIAHLAAQTLFTMSAHVRELRRHDLLPGDSMPVPPEREPSRRTAWLPILLPLAAAPLALLTDTGDDHITAGADLYLRFLLAYGLIFPAYVLLAMTFRRIDPTVRGHWLKFGILMLVLSVPYELGFIHHATYLLPFALLLIVISGSSRRLWLTSASGLR